MMPRVSTTLAAVLGFLLSISPSSLPHGMVLQGVVSAAFVLMSTEAVARLRPAEPRWAGRARAVLVGLLAGVGAGVLAWGDQVLDGARAEVGMPLLGWRYWAGVLAVVATGVLLRQAGRCAWRGRSWSRAVWRPLVAATVCAGLVLAGGPVHAAPRDGEALWILLDDSPVGAVRVYAGITPGEDVRARAERAADELVREGGLSRSRIVVAVPTGSGWVDPRFVTGLEQRFGADVATVSMQYDSAPSWLSYLLRRDRAIEGARVLFDAVLARVRQLPPEERPDLHVHGESLGATAGQAIFTGPKGAAAARSVCSVLWVGPPGGQRAGLLGESVVANADDPVVHGTWRTVFVPPDEDGVWLPLVSAVHDAVDFVGSTDVAVGTGHRYGRQQVSDLRTCRPSSAVSRGRPRS